MPTDTGFKAKPSTDPSAVEFHADQVTVDGTTALIERVKPSFGDPGSATDVSATNPLPVTDASAESALTSIEATLTSILGGEATQSTLAQLLTQLTALTAANHTDLAAVLAKLPSSPALDASVQSVLAKLPTSPALDASVQAVLAKLTSDPSTGAGQATQSGKLDTLHTDLAAVLAKQPSTPALDGTDATGVAVPAGAAGIRGWLSGIYSRLGGTLNVAVAGAGDVASVLTDGRKTVATPGTAVALASSSTCKWVTVTALLTNTNQVNVGGSAASAVLGSTTGTPLQAGSSITIPVNDPSKVFVDARVAGEGVSFTVGS